MKENDRLYPISEELFNEKVLPIIEANYIVNRIVQPTEPGEFLLYLRRQSL